MSFRIASLVGLWLVLSVGGLAALSQYKAKPGTTGGVPETWPASSRLALASDRPTLVLIAHPRCVCTRATISELAQLVSDVRAHVRLHILFVRPDGVSGDWMETDLLDRAREIEGAEIGEDLGGIEAGIFGAQTSGHVAIYDPSGRRLFHGGITGARGHLGQNAGLSRAVASVREGTDHDATGVFGCALADPSPEFAVAEDPR